MRRFIGFKIFCLIVLFTSCSMDVNEMADKGITADQTGDTADEVAFTAQSPYKSMIKLFDGDDNGVYHSFRIPSIVTAKNGNLIAFAEGRKNGNEDYGDINLVYKISTDNGLNWSSLMTVVGIGPGTWGNPTAVVDKTSGRVCLFMSWNSGTKNQFGNDGYDPIDTHGDRRVYYSYSDDHGLTWSEPENLTSTLLPPGAIWDAMGPGVGIQKLKSPNIGRLIIPAINRNIYSDDGGVTWQRLNVPAGSTSEGTVTELSSGWVMRNDRAISSVWNSGKRRYVSRGSSTGFSSFVPDNTLLDPKCQASTLRYNFDAPDRILFLNPASTTNRCKMRVRISYDDGYTWPISRAIYPNLTPQETCDMGFGGYSSMTKTADYRVGALIEINEDKYDSDGNRSIEFHKFNLAWILNGQSEPN